MPRRRFSGGLARSVRRERNLTQRALAASIGVSAPVISKWESGDDFPPGEKLPGLAMALGKEIDELFPREGLPDLTDLRCDAGYSQKQAADAIGISRGPLSNAERGHRRLNDDYVQPLAVEYKVTADELLAAQDRSFGMDAAPAPAAAAGSGPSAPRTVGEKIDFLVRHGYGDQAAPSDAEIASTVSKHVGATITADVIAGLRAGHITDVSPAVREGLAHALQVDVELFKDDAEFNPRAGEFLDAVRFLASIRQGQILALSARGNAGGLSAETMAKINEIVGELRHRLPDVPGSK